jgi:hypothetical protein
VFCFLDLFSFFQTEEAADAAAKAMNLQVG